MLETFWLTKTNTLCNGCILTRWSVLFKVFVLYGQCLISCHVYGHKFLEDVHKYSMQFQKSEQPVPVQPSGQAFEGVWMPYSI
jgi:hypothetical protein